MKSIMPRSLCLPLVPITTTPPLFLPRHDGQLNNKSSARSEPSTQTKKNFQTQNFNALIHKKKDVLDPHHAVTPSSQVLNISVTLPGTENFQFTPWTVLPNKLVEDFNIGITYFSETKESIGKRDMLGNQTYSSRSDYLLTFRNGYLMTRDNTPLPDGRYKFVVLQSPITNGLYCVAKHFDMSIDRLSKDRLKHTQLSNGENIFVGGQFMCKSGKLSAISTETGHYGGMKGGYVGSAHSGEKLFAPRIDAAKRLISLVNTLRPLDIIDPNIIIYKGKEISCQRRLSDEDITQYNKPKQKVSVYDWDPKKNKTTLYVLSESPPFDAPPLHGKWVIDLFSFTGRHH